MADFHARRHRAAMREHAGKREFFPLAPIGETTRASQHV
jgi:hypothetical protein